MSMPLLPFAQTIHANYPSFLHVLMPRAAHEISPAKSVDGQCVLPPCHGNLRDLPTHKVRSSSSHTKKSVDLFCSFGKLGKMSLLTSVNPQWGLTTANEHLGQGRPPTPPWVGFATLPAIAPHPLRQTSCRRLIH